MMTFEERVGARPDSTRKSYIKLKEVEQNSAGDHFAIAYMDNGMFRLRAFGEV